MTHTHYTYVPTPTNALCRPALFGIIPGFKTWHLFALMLIFKVMPLISGSGGGTKVTASHILVDTEEECAKIKVTYVVVYCSPFLLPSVFLLKKKSLILLPPEVYISQCFD